MRLSTATAVILLLGAPVIEALTPGYGIKCDAGQCLCGDSCRTLHHKQHCCPSKNGHREHICKPSKECCGEGCCREGWKCGKNEMCYPPTDISTTLGGCITTIITVTRPVPVHPTSDVEISSTDLYDTTSASSNTGASGNSQGVISSQVETRETPGTTTDANTASASGSWTVSVPRASDTTSNQHTTFPAPDSASSTDFQTSGVSSTPDGTTSANSIDQTNTSGTGGDFTIPASISTLTAVTNSDGQVPTVFPSEASTTHSGEITSAISSRNGNSGTEGIPTGSSISDELTGSEGQRSSTAVSPNGPGVTSSGQPNTSEATESSGLSSKSLVVTKSGQSSASSGSAATLIKTITDGSALTLVVSTNSNGKVSTITAPGAGSSTEEFFTSQSPRETLTTASNVESSTTVEQTVSSAEVPRSTTDSDGQATTLATSGTNLSDESSSIQASSPSTKPSGTESISASRTGSLASPSPNESTASITDSTETGVQGSSSVTSGSEKSGTSISVGTKSSETLQATSDPTASSKSDEAEPSSSIDGTKPNPSTTRSLIVTTNSGDHVTKLSTSEASPSITIPPSSTDSDVVGGYITPVTTTVSGPKPTDDGFVIPCNIWFFSSCLGWDDWNIFGWGIILPPGTYQSGPPPTLSIDPSAPFTVEIIGTLPEWPKFTVGPDNVPTYPPEPEGCETESAELCIARTSYGVSVSGTETKTTTTQILSTCGTVYGCNIEDMATSTTVSETATATAEPIIQAVYPLDGTNATQVGIIEQELLRFVNDSSEIVASDTTSFGVLFWRVPITIAQADEIMKLPDVASVNQECDNDQYPCYDPTIELVYEEDAGIQLSYLSWPNTNPRTPLSVLKNRYYFDDSFGEDIPVWIVDSGLTANHPEFDDIRDKVVWHNPVADYDGVFRQDDSQTDLSGIMRGKAHGSVMLGFVAGKTLGAARKVTPHVMRMPRKTLRGGGVSMEVYLEVLANAADLMEADPDGATAGVVLLASYYPLNEFYRKKGGGSSSTVLVNDQPIDQSFGFELRHYVILKQMIDKGFLVVTGTGNGGDSHITGWPASYGKAATPATYLPSLLVAGGILPGEPSGDRAVYGNAELDAGLPNIYAPGEGFDAVQGNTNAWDESLRTTYYKPASGTSDAAALTAGVAAYLVKLARLGNLKNTDGSPVTNTPEGIKDFMIAKSWSRGKFVGPLPGYVAERNGISNAADLSKPACKYNPSSSQERRQEGAVCELPLSPTSTTASSTSNTASSTTVASSMSSMFLSVTKGATLTVGDGTTATFSSPSGSSCAETTTIKQCAIGALGQSVCISAPSCASWINTDTVTVTVTPAEPTNTKTPLQVNKPVCNDESDFPDHKDVPEDGISTATYLFYDHYGDIMMYAGQETVSEISGSGVKISSSASWIDGCVTDVDEQKLGEPLGDDSLLAYTVLFDAWKDCINGGVGGYIDVGCVRYAVKAPV